MPVNHRDIQIPFTGGIDTKTDRKQVAPTKLLTLENGVFTKRGSIKKRNGYDLLKNIVDNPTFTGVNLQDGRALLIRNSELVAFDRQEVYSRADLQDSWINKGSMYSVSVTRPVLAKNTNEQTAADCCTLNGVTACAWEDSRGGVRLSVCDADTGTVFIDDFELEATGIRPRVVPINGFIIVLVVVPGTPSILRGFRLDNADSTTTPIPATIASDLRNTTPVYDVRPAGTAAILAYSDDTATLTVAFLTSAPALGGPASGFPAAITIAEDPEFAVAVAAGEGLAELGVAWANSVAGVRVQVFNPDLSSIAAIDTADSDVTDDTKNLTMQWANGGTILASVAYIYSEREETTPTDLPNRKIRRSSVTALGSASAPNVMMRHAGLASHAWSIGTEGFVNLVHDSNLQSTYFGVSFRGLPITKVLPGIAGGVTASEHLPSVNVDPSDSNIVRWTGIFKKRLDVEVTDDAGATGNVSGSAFAEKGIRHITYDFDDAQSHRSVQVGETAYIAGGFLWQYDGQPPVEAGFHLFPEMDDADLAESVGGALTLTSTYSYRVYYEWTNAAGERERSSTARSISFLLTGVNNRFTLTIPTLAMTSKRDEPGVVVFPRRTDVSIAVYRTEADPATGAPFHRVSSLDPTATGSNGYITNDPTVDTISFVDDLADTAIVDNELDYLNTGELDNIAPQAGKLITQGKDRIFLAGLDNPNEIAVSKLRFRGDVVAFNDTISTPVDRDGGPITALAMLNDVLVVFKEQRIYAMAGDGPNNFGFGFFNQAQLITTDVGCDNQRSVVTVPAGIMFQSSKGIYLLTQQFQVVYIGADVESFTVGSGAQTVTAATLIEDTNQVRFLVGSGSTLLYDYLFNQWSTFTNHEGTDAVNWRGVYTYIQADADTFTENPAKFLDNSTPYRLTMVTAWIKVAGGLQEFQRIRRAHVLGEFVSDHQLRMKVGFDYEDAFVETHLFDPSLALSTTTYGDSSPYGNETPYGGSSVTVYQLRAFMNRQKCQSIRFQFEDVFGNSPGASFEITELTLEAARKKGPFKLSSTRSV